MVWISFAATNFTLLRLEPSLGARARPKQPVTFRPRSESPHHGAGQQVSSLGPQLSTAGQHQGKVQQQSRSLDERRSRISRQRNSSFSSLSLTAEETRLSHYLSSAPRPDLRPDPRPDLRLEPRPDLRPDPSQPAAPPTITVRRPSMTCGLQPGGNSERKPFCKTHIIIPDPGGSGGIKCSDPVYRGGLAPGLAPGWWEIIEIF